LFFVIFVFSFPFLYYFVKAVENSCMVKLTSPNKLTEGDWLARPVKIGRQIIKPTVNGLSILEINALKKQRKKVLIKHGIPFVPVFLIAAIASILFGNIFIVLASWLAY